LRKNLSISNKKSFKAKKTKKQTLEMRNKRNSEDSSEKIWINKEKLITVNLNAEGSLKNLVSQVKLEHMHAMKTVQEL
jgi:outer membrane lipoprotein-sorting protein